MKTFYVLLLMMLGLAVFSVLISHISWALKSLFFILMILMSCYDVYLFKRQGYRFEEGRIKLFDQSQLVPVAYASSSVVTSFLCFLHSQSSNSIKTQAFPLSRLELSKISFRRLKSDIQRFLMSKN